MKSVIFRLVLIFLPGVSGAADGSGQRIIFDEGTAWTGSPLKVSRVLERVSQAGFNVYIPCVWHGQGALWPSQTVVPWVKNPDLAKADPLRQLITLAHRRDIKVMPCFTVMARQHGFFPEWATAARSNLFNVHHPGFREFIVGLLRELAEGYDIDGINLDYVRAGQVCYETLCRDSYQAFSGRSLMRDLELLDTDPQARQRIVAWQRQAVTSLMEELVAAVHRVKPGLPVTLSAAPWADSVVIEGQDSIHWLRTGLVDSVLSMNYEEPIPWERLRQARQQLPRPEQLLVMFASYDQQRSVSGDIVTRPKSAGSFASLLSAVSRFNRRGSFAVYFYSWLSNEHIRILQSHTAPVTPSR